MGTLKIINKIKDFAAKTGAAADIALQDMAIDIERLAKNQVPFKDGHLKSTGKHLKLKNLSWVVLFGDTAPSSKYAAYQEFGGDGKGKVVRRYSMSGKKKFFLRDPGNMVSAKALSYFRKALVKTL